MSDGHSVVTLARDLAKLEALVATKVDIREVDDIKEDVRALNTKLDQIIRDQISTQRTALLQLAGILLTLLLAGYGALT